MASMFMQGIPNHWKEIDVVREIASLLHGPTLLGHTGTKSNFNVHLHADRRRPGHHRGQGTLILPTVEIGSLFLAYYSNVPIKGARLTFRNDKFAPNRDVLRVIQTTPYIDPEVEQAYQERVEKLSSFVNIVSLQLGWQCRDDVFSMEWDAATSPLPLLGSNPVITFKADTNELWFCLGGPPTTNPHLNRRHHIISRFSRVESVAVVERRLQQPSILFTFSCPPALEAHDYQVDRDKPFRHRLSFFDNNHAPIAPFVGLALRVVCASLADLQLFLRMAEVSRLPAHVELTTIPTARHLFTDDVLARIRTSIAGLAWPVAFQCEAILYAQLMDPTEFEGLIPKVIGLVSVLGEERAAKALYHFIGRLQTWSFDSSGSPPSLQGSLNHAIRIAKDLPLTFRTPTPDDTFFDCYHVRVTPTRLVLDGPFADQTNRVIRRYYGHRHCFLRVNFADEESLGYRWDRDVDGTEFVKQRVGGVLKKGITIAGRDFDFLAYSSSALKEHAVWFCTPFHDDDGHYTDAQAIRDSLGNFGDLVYQPAKYGARMAQAFTATEPSVTLPDIDEIQVLPDITYDRFTFTDGVGVISPRLAKRISKKLQSRPGSRKRFFIEPSAYQFRMGGFKGVVFVDYGMKDGDIDILLRQSQRKFTSTSTDLEIAQPFFRAKPFFLNRSLVMILETLGVTSGIFLKLQDEAVDDVEASTESMQRCADFLETHGCGTSFRVSSVFSNLVKYGVDWRSRNPDYALNERFLFRAIRFAKNHVLRVIKHKARIPAKGCYTLVGIADTYGYLKENEVYVCVMENRKKGELPLSGDILVTRSPQVHPGDVQYVRAVGLIPEGVNWPLKKCINCVVFSTKGTRDVPSMLSGGDLDGDEYNVITNNGLFPSQCDAPGSYTSAQIKQLARPCEVEDLTDWVVDYINNDILGFIADQHLQLADQRPTLARDPDCIKLAELASKAVDFAKNGTPVDRKEMPQSPMYRPDWAAGELGRNRGARVYESQRTIGKLFRRIDLSKTERMAAQEARRQHDDDSDDEDQGDYLARAMGMLTVDTRHPITRALYNAVKRRIDIEQAFPPEMVDTAQRQFEAYEAELRYICAGCSLSRHPLTEEEVLMGTIIAKTSQPARRKSLMSHLRMQTNASVKRIRGELEGDDEDELLEEWIYKSWIAWQVALDRGNGFGARSYGIIAVGSILECLKKFEEEELEQSRSRRNGR